MRLVFTVLWLLLAKQAFSQTIVGFWQASDTTVGSNYQQHYIFSADNKFTYTPSGYDGLQRILKIGGHYKLLGNTLYLTAEYTTELKGGVLERSHITTLNDSWSFEGGQANTYKIAKPIRQAVQFKLVKRTKGLYMLLDTWPYYKIKVSANQSDAKN